jgi:hypothetical protein
MNRTVILACSARKRHDIGELSALARYDGPAWRTLRAHLSCIIEPPFALSAEHGLISVYHQIPDYDRRLTPKRVAELVDPVSEQIARLHREGRLRGEIFVYGGSLYRELIDRAMQKAQLAIRRELEITFAIGPIGRQLQQLKAFLTREPRLETLVVDEEEAQ